MRLTPEQARERFRAARVARFATADGGGRPHLVPVTFAVVGDVLTFAVDHKPKSTTALRRLANIAANPAVSVLADDYDEDWDRQWWARADGSARVLQPGSAGTVQLLDALAARYAQYRERRPEGPVVAVDVASWSGWAAT